MGKAGLKNAKKVQSEQEDDNDMGIETLRSKAIKKKGKSKSEKRDAVFEPHAVLRKKEAELKAE